HIDDRLARGAAPAAVEKSEPGRLLLFGPPQLIAGGRALPASAWRAQRAFQMLVYLALRPRGASREELLESFWPGRQLAAGKRNFHPTLSYVRARAGLRRRAGGVPPRRRDGRVPRVLARGRDRVPGAARPAARGAGRVREAARAAARRAGRGSAARDGGGGRSAAGREGRRERERPSRAEGHGA